MASVPFRQCGGKAAEEFAIKEIENLAQRISSLLSIVPGEGGEPMGQANSSPPSKPVTSSWLLVLRLASLPGCPRAAGPAISRRDSPRSNCAFLDPHSTLSPSA